MGEWVRRLEKSSAIESGFSNDKLGPVRIAASKPGSTHPKLTPTRQSVS